MRAVRATVVALFAAVAASAWASPGSWQRRIVFATRLYVDRHYVDLADAVIDEVAKDTSVRDEEKAELWRRLAEHYVERVMNPDRGRDALRQMTDHLAKAREYFARYVNHPSLKADPEERSKTRVRLVWIMVHLARVHVRIMEDEGLPKPDRDKARAEAITVYRSVINEFTGLVKEKAAEQAKVEALEKTAKDRKKWDEAYNAAREEHVRVRMYLNETRVELGKLLKRTGAPPAEWKPLIEAACKDFDDLLRKFIGDRIIQVQVPYAEALVELGPEKDPDALERLTEVWQNRTVFLENEAVPCKAMHVKASILFRQKKYREACEALDEMIKARAGVETGTAAMGMEMVADLLRNLEYGEQARRYDSKAMGQSFLLAADAYAALAKQAEDAKKPSKEVEKLYGIAYEIGAGAWEAKAGVNAEYVKRIEQWRVKSKKKETMSSLLAQITDLLRRAPGDKTLYVQAAKLYTDVIGDRQHPRDQLRSLWENIARCYYAGGAYYEAYIVFSSLARWFPEPQPQAVDYAKAAVAAIKAQYDLSVKQKAEPGQVAFDKKLYDEAQVEVERAGGREGYAVIRQAKDLARQGRFDDAIGLLRDVRPDHPAYPHALYQIGLICRQMFQNLRPAEQKGVEGKTALRNALAAFQECLDHCKKVLPGLTGDEKADERRRLLDAAAACIAIYTDTLLEDHLNQPAKVIEVTANVSQNYPGAETAFAYGYVLYNRMRAAVALSKGGDTEQASKALPILEECWKALQKLPAFKYIANAAAMGAGAYGEVAKKLEEDAKKTTDEAAKAALVKRAAAARDRGLEFYFELLAVAPRQTLRTYRYILYQLEKRPHEPKSADYRKIIEYAPKAIEYYGDDADLAEEVRQVKLALAAAQARLDNWRDALPLFEEVRAAYEPDYRRRMADYERRKRLHDENPQRYPAPRLPSRDATQLQARRWLVRGYIETNARAKLKDVRAMCGEHMNLYHAKMAEHWEALYYFVEAARQDGEYDDVVRGLYKAGESIVLNPGDPELKGSKRDFHELAVRCRKTMEGMPDAQRKAALLKSMDQIIEKLSK